MAAQSWMDRFPALADLGPDVRRILERESRLVRLPAGTRVFGPGKAATDMLLMLDGQVRVQQSSDSGREIVLYRVDAGESCIMTTACLLAHEAYAAEGIAETEIEAVAIPRRVFDELIASSEAFRTFVFTAYARRIADLFRVIDDVAFGRIDVRLAARLLDLAREADTVVSTHQNLATELGTAREVISRQLNEFQRRGWVEQARGRITLKDRAALATLAAA